MRYSFRAGSRLLPIFYVCAALFAVWRPTGVARAVPPVRPVPPANAGLRLGAQTENTSFKFAVTADMRYYAGSGDYDSLSYFRGAATAIAGLPGIEFMVTPGDMDPVPEVRWTIDQVLGSAFTWFPVVGNHELPNAGYESSEGANMAWLRSYDYGAVNPGPSGCPETTFSFDYLNVHFVMLNEYCDVGGEGATTGDIPDHLYNWLLDDLVNSQKEHILIFGHEPAFPQPDAENGRLRHASDSLNFFATNRDRFWSLLQSTGVLAYICGHTHNYSLYRQHGVWQLDAGHARGLGDPGARSTFVIFSIEGGNVFYQTYRDDSAGGSYTLRYQGFLESSNPVFLPLLHR